MSERTKIVATVESRTNNFNQGDTLHIYWDALMVVLKCGKKRHLLIRKVLKADHPGAVESSKVGKTSVFLLPFDVGNKNVLFELPAGWVALVTGYCDHRESSRASHLDEAMRFYAAAATLDPADLGGGAGHNGV